MTNEKKMTEERMKEIMKAIPDFGKRVGYKICVVDELYDMNELEKDARDYEKKKHYLYEENEYCGDIEDGIIQAYIAGAEFSYNKAINVSDLKVNEWHEIESKISPKREISKQYMPKNKEKVLLKYHFSGDDEVHISDGYYDAYDSEFHIANNPKYRIICVIAWKEIEQ